MKKILFSAVVFAAVFPLFLQGESLVEIATGNFFAEVPPRASVFGKYAGLKQRFHCPDTLYKMSFHNNLRNFHDLGLYEKTETWCGTKLQPGFIVYYGGTWYVWEKQVINKHSEQVLATMNGTYTGLLKKKYCRHMKTKGRFIEFGYLTSPMCDNPNKSDTGFFVYVQPYVYIYTNLSPYFPHNCRGRRSVSAASIWVEHNRNRLPSIMRRGQSENFIEKSFKFMDVNDSNIAVRVEVKKVFITGDEIIGMC